MLREKLIVAAALLAILTPSNAFVRGGSAPSGGGSFTAAWQAVKLGSTGLSTYISVYPDGTMLSGNDTNGAYKWNAGTSSWQQLFQESAFGSTYPATSSNISTPASYGGAYACAYPIDSSSTLVGSTSIQYAMWNGVIWKSTNAGVSWTDTGNTTANDGNGTGRYNGPFILCDPASSGSVVYIDVNGGIAKVSSNGGSTFANVPSLPAAAGGTGDTTFAADPTSSVVSNITQHLYAAVDGSGLWESYNGGTSFTKASTAGMPTAFNSLKVDRFGVVWTVSQTTASKYVPSGTAGTGAWTNLVSNGVSTTQTTNGITVDSSSASQVAQRIVISDQKGGIQISTNNGGSWSAPTYVAYTAKPTATDVPWIGTASYNANDPQSGDVYLQMQQVNFDTSGNLIASIGVGILKCPAPLSSSNCSGTGWVNATAGIEQLVTTRVISPPGNGPFVTGWDRGIFGPVNPDIYPSIQYDNLIDIAIGQDVDYAANNAFFMVVMNVSNVGRGDFSGFSTNGGHSWTRQQFNSTPAPTGSGGMLAVGDANHWAMVPNGITSGTAVQCTSNAGSTWGAVSLSGSPVQNYVSSNVAAFGQRHILAADKGVSHVGTFYIYNFTDNKVYSGTCGSMWAPGAAVTGFPTGKGGWGYNAIMVAVPGQDQNLFMASGNWLGNSHPVSGATLQRSTDGGATWSAVSNMTEVYAIGFGAPKPGNTYPTIYINGWYNGVVGIFKSTDNAATFQNTDATVVYPNGNVSGVLFGSGDMNVYGRVYLTHGYEGAGASYYDTSDACPWVNFDPADANIYPTNNVTGTLTITAKASGKPQATITSVSFYLDGVLIGTQTNPSSGTGTQASPYAYQQSWNAGAATPGSHTLQVATSGNGCTASSSSTFANFSIPITTH